MSAFQNLYLHFGASLILFIFYAVGCTPNYVEAPENCSAPPLVAETSRENPVHSLLLNQLQPLQSCESIVKLLIDNLLTFYTIQFILIDWFPLLSTQDCSQLVWLTGRGPFWLVTGPHAG